MRKVLILGSEAYRFTKMQELYHKLEKVGHEVRLVEFDHSFENVRDVIMANCERIEWADDVYVLWNGRSTGTVFDMGAIAMLHYLCRSRAQEPRPVVHVVDTEPQTFEELFIEMAEASQAGCPGEESVT